MHTYTPEEVLVHYGKLSGQHPSVVHIAAKREIDDAQNGKKQRRLTTQHNTISSLAKKPGGGNTTLGPTMPSR